MDKNAIKTFAIESRRQLIESVKYQASLIGITSEGISGPVSKAEGMETYDYGAGTYSIFDEDIRKRESLVREVTSKGFDNVVEEVAYTWFNRIVAIRFMEVNDYLPTRTRVLSSEIEDKIEPDIVTEALDLDFDYNNEDRELILKLKDENKLNELFIFLFIKQCNKLNEILPGLFERTDDYMELLLNISFTDDDGVVRKLIDSIPEDSFGEQVEIIGWLYQFYNTELKDETFSSINSKVKISKERIPAVTQLFTPDWIVKYMVENSLGRLWLDSHPNDELKLKWKYYVDEHLQDTDVELKLVEIKKQSSVLNPEDIKIIDPCMGSGHILVYVFEILMDIYVSEGFTERDACEAILKNNIYGLDIDKRAYQLSYFAVLMKARKYNRKILNKDISPLLCSIEETNLISEEFINDLISYDDSIKEDINYIFSSFKDAKEYGSILEIKEINFDKINESITNFELSNNNLKRFEYQNDIIQLRNIINQSKLLSLQYDIVITNPPYMGSKGMNSNLKGFLKKNYPNSKSDLFAVFIEKCHDFCNENGFVAMITQQAFMFLSTYEELRKKLINNNTIINMVHLGPHAFEEIGGEVVQATSFINRNRFIDNYISTFYKLTEFQSEKLKENEFFNDENKYYLSQNMFNSIPSFEFVFWEDLNLLNSFKLYPALSNYAKPSRGLATYNDALFLRFWYETSFEDIGFDCESVEDSIKSKKRWFPYNKGGDYRKWYGNNSYVVNFYNEGEEIKKVGKAAFSNIKHYFEKGLTWSRISSKYFGVRYHGNGFVIGDAGPSVLLNDETNIFYLLGILLSNFTLRVILALNSSLTFQVGDLNRIPINIDNTKKNLIEDIVKSNIKISKEEWDEFEISWDFSKHPALKFDSQLLEDIYSKYVDFKRTQFDELKNNEILLNKEINELYGVEEEVIVDDKDITLKNVTLKDFIKNFISYAVGCMFGRYSLDNEGLQFAGGEFNINNYNRFKPDKDNIIPILDTEYFEDDIVGCFVDFVKACFGEEYLEDNLNFIAGALKKKGKTSREIIRNYFLTDFFNDHVKMYKKCPIYWQFDSGEQNAFKCLIYLHRYDSGLIAHLRTDYLHKTQKAIEHNLTHCDNVISNSTNKSDISKATTDKAKYLKQLDEIKNYDEVLRHMANQYIKIDLDDGVKVNYNKFQNVELSKEGERNKTVPLLKEFK